MASIGWLLLDAGFGIMADSRLSLSVISDVSAGGRAWHLGLSVLLGAMLLFVTRKFDKSWTLPVASMVLVTAYYLAMTFVAMPHNEQQANGWLFYVNRSDGGALAMLSVLSPHDINWGFVVTVIPQMATVLLLALLYASMTLTALKSSSPYNLSIADEFKNIGCGNLFCAAVCSPAGFTEVVATVLYREFGASSRWMPLAITAVGIAIVSFGSTIIEFLPKLLIGGTIFMFAFQMLYEWLYQNIRKFSAHDLVIVLSIFATAITFGFMTGIGIGVLLTVLLFVMRYSKISAIHSRTTLFRRRSSVERSAEDNRLLENKGDQAVIYSLRGFLFFGTANGILDTIQYKEHLTGGDCKALLLDMDRVTGIDISALMVFTQIKQLCERHGALLSFSGTPPHIKEQLLSMHAVSVRDGQSLIFDEADYALEYLENLLIDQHDSPAAVSIRDYLMAALEDETKTDRLLKVMQKRNCKAQEVLFRQGETDNGLYLVASGSFSAYILAENKPMTRVRKFKPGSLIGELSAYLKDNRRTATIIADVDSVVYHLNLVALEQSDSDLAANVHEMVAITLAERVQFMNERLSASV
jgi:SulP family sulfate permease